MTVVKATTEKSQPITATERFGAIEAFTARFRDHLIETPGAVLAPALRLAVIEYSREASSCTACASALPSSACLRPGTDLYKLIEKIEHDPTNFRDEAVPETVQTVLLTIVHSVVNHQGRLNQKWYESAIEMILTTNGILPSNIGEDEGDTKKQCLAYVAFSEILILSTMSHGMAVAFQVMGRPLPPLPTLEEMKTKPMLLDWTKLLKQAPRHDPKVCFARINYPGDYDKRSADFQSISNKTWSAMTRFMDPFEPAFPVAYATNDVVFFREMSETYFVQEKDFMQLYKTDLDPTVRCADSFSRYEAEFIATQVAAAYNCRF